MALEQKMARIKISLIQLDVGSDKDGNLSRARGLILKAAKNGASVVCLPELFSYMGPFKFPRKVAEDKNGPSISLMRGLAREHKIHIVAGSILERTKRGLPFNTCFFIDPAGRVISSYSKLHLFDINIPGKIRFEESKFMRPGKFVTVTKSAFGKVGFAICNDLRYPEVFRKMVMAGARIIFVPSAFTKFTGRDHWIALNSVRAIENQCYIAAVNQSGKNADGVRFFGSSIIVDPWGRILKEGPSKGDAIVSCAVDLYLVDKIRHNLPALKKIRSVYRLKSF